MAVNVFHHHNGIVDQNANGKNQGKQANAVEREAPGPAGKQGGGQSQNDCTAHNDGFAFAQCQTHQQNDRGGGKGQLLNQLVGFFCSGFAVVACDGGFNALGQYGVSHLLNTRTSRARHIDSVLARLLGHRHRDSGVHLALQVGLGSARHVAHILLGLLCTLFNLRHFFQVDGLACVHAHHHIGHVLS